MGTWNTGIFDDDFARDVREETLQQLRSASTEAAALRKILANAPKVDDDPDEGPTFWLALAATLWALGRLTPLVKKRALAVIAEGTELDRWSGRQRTKRKAVLEALGEQLRSPQPRRKPLPKADPPVNVKSHHLDNAGLRAVAFEIGERPDQLGQVSIESAGGGGSVFAGRCREDEIDLRWIDAATLEIAYPKKTKVQEREEEWFFCGRTVRCVYRLK